MSCTNYDNISISDLENQLEEAKKALVDKKYKNYSEMEHLFEYNIDFKIFLEDMSYILEKSRNITSEEDSYRRA